MIIESLFVFLSNLVLFVSLTTLVFAVAACIALGLRRRRPLARRRDRPHGDEAPLLRRYIPPEA
jgi:hypothetical protein